MVERGTHDEMLGAGGRYAALYRTQFAQDGADGVVDVEQWRDDAVGVA